MAMRRPRIKAAANILSAKRKPKATAGEAKTSAESDPAPAKPTGAQPNEEDVGHVDEKASEVTAESMAPKIDVNETISPSEIGQDKQSNGIEAEEKAKDNTEKPIGEESNTEPMTAKDDKSQLSSNHQPSDSPPERIETPSSSAETQPAKTTRRPRIRATANVVASTKKRSLPGLGPSATENIKAEKNVSETDSKESDVPQMPSDSCETNQSQQSGEAPKSAIEMAAKSSEESSTKSLEESSSSEEASQTKPPEESSSSKEAAQTKPPTATRRPRLKAAANVMASKRRSKPGLNSTAPNAGEDEQKETEQPQHQDAKKEVVKKETLVSPKKEDLNSSSEEFVNDKNEEKGEKPPSGSVREAKSVPSPKPPLDDSSSFKCPTSVEYAALHGNQPSAVPSNSADEAATTEYEDILQSDLQKSLLGPPMSPSSPSKAVSRQRIRMTPNFGQRRNSFVGSSPHNTDDGNVSDSHPSSSPYQHHRRERHYSGAHTPFSTMASPALSLGGGSTGHYGSPHKYAPLIPSGRIRTESSCSTFSDFVGGSQKPRKVDDNLARRRDFEARFTNGVPDKASIKMSDLIYYNPVTNPMEAKPRNQIKAESKPAVEEYPKQELKEEAPDYDSAMPVPQLKLNADGELIIDDKSLEIETTAEQEARKILAKSSLIYLDENTGMNGFYKRHKRTKDWAPDETIKFYRCLQILGTDFSLMCQLFPNRTRRDLKLKFKKEERCNAALINKALMHPKEFNIDELTKQFEEEDNAREEAEKKWKEIKAANPKCVNKVKQKQAHISAASRILNSGPDIYENENIIKKKLGKRALSAQKKAKKPLGESEDVPEPNAETNKRQTRKRRLKDESTLAACSEATPAKQISLDVEIDDDEISRGLNELLETPIIEYSPYQDDTRPLFNQDTSAQQSPHVNRAAEESQPVTNTISTTTISTMPATTTTTIESPPPLDLAPVEYPLVSTQLNNVSFPLLTNPSSVIISQIPVQPGALSSVLDNSYSLVCPATPSTDVWQPAAVVDAPPKPPSISTDNESAAEMPVEVSVPSMTVVLQPDATNQQIIAPMNNEPYCIPTTVDSTVDTTSLPMDIEIMSPAQPTFEESPADMHSPSPPASPIPMDYVSSQEASLDGLENNEVDFPDFVPETPEGAGEPSEEDLEPSEEADETLKEARKDLEPSEEADDTLKEVRKASEEMREASEKAPEFSEDTPETSEDAPEPLEDAPEPSEDPKASKEFTKTSENPLISFSIPLEKHVVDALTPTEEKTSSAEGQNTISFVESTSNVDSPNTPTVPETPQPQKPLSSPRVSETIQLAKSSPETSPSKLTHRYMSTFTEEELMPSTSKSAKIIQERARREELRQQEVLRQQEEQRQQELKRREEQAQEQLTPKDDTDIYDILTEIVKGTLVLVSTLKPNSDEMMHEVFVQDLETEELVGEALPLPQHQIDRIVQMMGDDEEEDDGQD